MSWYQWSFFGMHYFWWLVWGFFIVSLFSWGRPVSRRTMRLYTEEPLGILQRRYAAGDITSDEYEQRKSRIERDLVNPKLRRSPA